MPKFKPPVALLQPLTQTTPLAGLYNDWLVSLAHVLSLTSARQRSRARELLYGLTLHLHLHYHTVERLISLLDQEETYGGRWPKPGIGARFEQAELCMGYAAQTHRLKTPQHIQWLNNLSPAYLSQINAAYGPFCATRERLLAVQAYSITLGIDLEMLDSTGPDITQAEVVTKLKALLNLELS